MLGLFIALLIQIYVIVGAIHFVAPYIIRYTILGPETARNKIIKHKVSRSHIILSILWPIGLTKNIIRPYSIDVDTTDVPSILRLNPISVTEINTIPDDGICIRAIIMLFDGRVNVTEYYNKRISGSPYSRCYR